MSNMFNPRVPSPIDISPPPSYSSLSPVMSSPTLTRYPAPRGDVSDEPHESQRLLGIVLDRAKYEETSPSPPLSCPIWEGGADVFSFPGFTRSISLLLDRSSPSSYTDPDGLSSGAHTLVSSFHASSPCKPKQNLSGSRLAILVPSPTLSQSISSSRALLFDSDDSAISSSPLNSSSPNTISSFATVYIPFPESLPIISDPSHPNMLLHAPMPTRHIPRGVSRLSPLERGAREMLGESAPETRMPTPQKHFSSLYERTGSTLISPLSPPQSRFSARLRKLAPPALQLAPTSVEFCSPGSSASISGLRILQASSAQQGTTAIGLGINVPRIVQPEILVQQTPSPVHSPQVTRTPAVPEPEEAQDPQVPQFGCLGSADSPALEYMDIGSPRTPPNLPRPTLLSLPTVTPAVSQGVHYGFTSPFETVRGQQRDLVEDVPMLPAYVEVAEADRYPRHLGAHILDQSIVDTSRLPALDLLFVARSDTGDLLDRVARCVDVIHPIGLSLGACSFIPAEHLYPLCDSLREVLINVGDALRSCPTGFDLDIHELGEHWYAKYRNLIASLERNANLFYLLAEQISRRPPRGHKLNSHMSKLHQYVRKFDDLHKRLLYFHERVDILKLRSRLNASKRRAQEQKQVERERRRVFNISFEEGRAHRHELREELREAYRVRATRFPSGVGRGNPPPGWF